MNSKENALNKKFDKPAVKTFSKKLKVEKNESIYSIPLFNIIQYHI
jgi:hypothetical protein